MNKKIMAVVAVVVVALFILATCSEGARRRGPQINPNETPTSTAFR